MSYTRDHKQASNELYADEPGGRWHVMTEKYGGGPAFRWKNAGYLQAPTKSRLNKQEYDLAVTDLLPQFLQSIMGLKIAVQYKPSSNVICYAASLR